MEPEPNTGHEAGLHPGWDTGPFTHIRVAGPPTGVFLGWRGSPYEHVDSMYRT